jgi:hypothetical protein
MFVVLVSPVTLREIRRAPARVQDILDDLPEECVEFVDAEEEGDALADAYLATGALRRGAGDDAAHVATATVAGADMILSWNFRDILRYDRKKMFHGVSVMKGYHAVDMLSPLEVDYGEEDTQGLRLRGDEAQGAARAYGRVRVTEGRVRLVLGLPQEDRPRVGVGIGDYRQAHEGEERRVRAGRPAQFARKQGLVKEAEFYERSVQALTAE